MQRTYQTRLSISPEQQDWLAQYAALAGRVERTLFAETLARGIAPGTCKNQYLRRFGLTARQFNAIARPLKGKVKSVVELRKRHLDEDRERLKSAGKTVRSLTRKLASQQKTGASRAAIDKTRFKLHQAKRRLFMLEHRHEQRLNDHQSGRVRLCFGGKKLFRKQFHLAENGYEYFDDWKADWQAARARQFYVLGSKDETAGCQGCQLQTDPQTDALSLSLRLPNALIEQGASRHLLLPVSFAWGAAAIRAALNAGQAISYRFVRDAKGWRVFVTTRAMPVETGTRSSLGAIGVDLNADHLAVAEADRFGNPINGFNIPLHTQGLSTDQAAAVIGDGVKSLMAYCAGKSKPIVIEDLDFARKKAQLRKSHPAQARMLSSLNYNRVKEVLCSRAYDQGIEVKTVNPAYTSIIGLWKFAGRYRLNSHQSAALVIARRGLGLSERPNRRDRSATQIPVRKSGLPARSVWVGCARQKATFAALHERRWGKLPPSSQATPECDRARSGSCMAPGVT